MKTAAQVFIIIGMVVGFWMILPLIFGGIALSQMGKGMRPSTGMSVCVLLFCNTIAGILLLVAKDDELGRKLQDLELTTRKRAPRNGGD